MTAEHASTTITDAPVWFRAALAAPVQTGSIVVDGADITYRAWGPSDASGVVLVHGGAAHSRWWDHVAPLLAEGRRVVALDLSGHGDSSRRTTYALPVWAREVRRVADEAGIAGHPVVVGHSMGGFVALQTALDFGTDLGGVVVIDSPVHDLSFEERVEFQRHASGTLRTHISIDAALDRFHPIPDQDVKIDFVLDHVARTSLAETEGGWRWKFDPEIFRDAFLGLSQLTAVDCHVALLRAEYGRLTTAMNAAAVAKLGPETLQVEIPAAGHHVMLDQPLALVTGLRTVLEGWASRAGSRQRACEKPEW